MKKALLFTATAVLVVGSFAGCGEASKQGTSEIPGIYADCGVIMDEPDGWITVTMQNGHMFCFEDEDGDWMIGDIVSMVMDDNGTDVVTDDIIVDYRYSGWVSQEAINTWIK